MSDDKPKPSTTYGAAAADAEAGACPACGVSVPRGYIKCPKCQAAMPQKGKMPRARTEPGGGTSVRAGQTISLTAVLVVAAATALIVYLANREDDTPQARAPRVSAGAYVADDDLDDEATIDGMDAGAIDEAPVAEASYVQLDALYDALAAAELHTWVDVDADAEERDVVVLRSWYCNDDRVVQQVDEAAPALRGAGFAVVRCLERADRVVFERELR